MRAAIITGAGDKAFCAGADLSKLIPLFTRARQPQDEWNKRVMEARSVQGAALLRGFSTYKPVIAGSASPAERS